MKLMWSEAVKFESHCDIDGRYTSGDITIWERNSGVYILYDDPMPYDLNEALVKLVQSSNEVVLKTSAFRQINQVVYLAVEPVRGKPIDPLSADVLIESSEFHHFIRYDIDLRVYVFTNKFKDFLRSLLKLMVEESEKNVFIKVEAKNIVLTAEKDKLKIFNLCSRYTNLSDSLGSVLTFISKMVKKATPQNYKFADEVLDFIYEAPPNKKLVRHPALLKKGDKLRFMLELYKCNTIWDAQVDAKSVSMTTRRSHPCPDWQNKIDPYVDLKTVYKGPVNPIKGVHDTVGSLLEFVRHLHVHINDRLVYFGPKYEYSPLKPHKYGRLRYKDTDLELMIDYLFPKFASWLHNADFYDDLDKCR